MSKWDTIGRKLPRVPFGHAIITPQCRHLHPGRALDEAVERLRASYVDVVRRHGNVQVHVLLVATWPEDDQPDGRTAPKEAP